MTVRTVAVPAALLAALLAAPVAAQDTARGTVFDDRDADGVRDAGEPGVPGVALSNGRDVVQTDAEGAYAIALREHDVLFLTKPSGWAVPRDADNLPRFFHVHAPAGSPPELRLRFPGVPPTGPLPDPLDFPLRRDPDEGARFRSIWIADPQPQTSAELDYLRDAFVNELLGVEAEFGITVGDIMFDDLSLLPRSNALVGRIGIPWYNVPGNHELNFEAPDDRWSNETFKRTFGPTNYSFDVGDAHFVVLDDVFYLGTDPTDERGQGPYEGRLTDEQLGWLAADLARVPSERLVVVAMHIPLGSADAESGASHVRMGNAERFFDVIESFTNLLLVAGHTHTAEHHHFGAEHGFDGEHPLHLHVLSTVSGSWWSGPMDERGVPTSWTRDGAPKGYYVMEVDGAAVNLRFRGLRMPADEQIRLCFDSTFHGRSANGQRDFRPGELVAGRIDADHLHATELVANVFNGGPRSRVSVRLDDGEPWPMERRFRRDPFIVDLFTRHADSMKSWVAPEKSTHVWVTRLPPDLALGAHTVHVVAVDDYGNEHRASAVLEVTGR